jgi:sortase A
MTRRVLRGVAVVFLVLAVLIVGDVAWQIWGTAWQQQRAQQALRSKLDPSLILPKKSSGGGGGTTSTTSGSATVAVVAVGQPIGIMSIPAIGLSQVIVQGTDEGQLAQGPGHYLNTAMPGQVGNVAIAGHRTTYGHPFYNLQALVAGDSISIQTPGGTYHYSVISQQIVNPSDTAVLDSSPGKYLLTLTTCNPRYSAAQRLVVTAQLVP